MRPQWSNLRLALGLVAVGVIASCSDPASPVNRELVPSGAGPASTQTGPPDPVKTELTVCKFGADANFSWNVNGVPRTGFSLLDGQCALVYTSAALGGNIVTVTETADSLTVHDSTVVIGIIGSASNPGGRVDTLVITNGLSARVRIGLEWGAVLAFYNTPVPPPQPASLGDFVWDDLDHDGIQDSGEPGIDGVMVNLFDCSNNPVSSTLTDSTGFYQFGNLVAGCYVVEFVAPGGYVFSPANQGGDPTLDSDANTTTGLTAQITLVAGQADATWDAGLFQPAQPSSLGDFVWNDLNRNGIQDSGEPGLTGVTVNLYDCSNTLLTSATTDGNGNYLFGGLAAGCYVVEFVAPSGYVFSPANQGGTPSLDSDANTTTGRTPNISLAAGVNDLTWDAGVNVPPPPPASLGDFVWNDLNRNGVQDSGEPGISGVTVNLYDCSNNLVATTTTNGSGGYLFSNLAAGCYVVAFVAPGGFVFSPANQGGNPALDSDANTGTGKTGQITLVAGQNDLTQDAGLNQPVVNACTNGPIGGINLGVLPNYLFLFANGSQDANWQGATKGFAGDVAVDGILAKERTSGGVPYAGTIFTNDGSLSAWQQIVNQNAGQAFASTGQTALVSGLKSSLTAAFAQINGLPVTAGYTSRSATSLNGVNTQNGVSETIVVNVTSGFGVSSKINITGDAGDVFVLRWDTDANFGNGYQGIVKFQSGGAIVPLGGLKPGSFIHVAGDISSSGGGSTPAAPYPQGPRLNNGTGSLITGGSNFSGGGFFTGYWLTTGNPSNGTTQSLSNAVFVGGWYSTTTKFSMTSGTSGVHVCP